MLFPRISETRWSHVVSLRRRRHETGGRHGDSYEWLALMGTTTDFAARIPRDGLPETSGPHLDNDPRRVSRISNLRRDWANLGLGEGSAVLPGRYGHPDHAPGLHIAR